MKITTLANAAILAGIAAAQLRLPLFSQAPPASAFHRGEPDDDRSVRMADGLLRYLVNVTVGMPEREISLFITHDDHMAWLPDAAMCEDDVCPGGSFDASNSQIWGTYAVTYPDGTYVSGNTVKEVMSIGDIKMNASRMGLGSDGVFTQGELSMTFRSARDDYSFFELLINEGAVTSPAYSFWLEKDAASGNLLLGAIDASVFEGPLKRLRIRWDSPAHFPVVFAGLHYTSSTGGDPEEVAPQDSLPIISIMPAHMLTNLPSTLANTIWDLAGATYDTNLGLATISCSGGNGEVSELILRLGSEKDATVRVSFDDLIIPHDMAPIGKGSDDETCIFAIQNSEDASVVGFVPPSLGGFLLRNTYIVFDRINAEVALAPLRATGGSQTEDIVPFPSYGAQVPLSEDADCGDYTCDSYVWPDNSPHSKREPLSAFKIIFICLGCIAVLAILIWWFLRRHGYCCFKGRGKENKLAAARRIPRGPISGNIAHAGALPYPRQARLSQAYTLPPGCGWEQAYTSPPGYELEPMPPGYELEPTTVTARSSATTLAGPRSAPSAPGPPGSSAGAPGDDHPVNSPTERPVSPLTPEPAAGHLSPPSTQPPAPGGTSPLAEEESPNPSETGNAAGRRS